jgi:hypothetical protein
MRMHQPVLLVFTAIVFAAPLLAQQADAPQAAQNTEAMSILGKALIAGGGAQAVTAVSDYTANGTITYYPGGQLQGTVTVIGTNSQEFRMDATLPSGVRSWAVHDGIVTTKSEAGSIESFGSNVNLPSSDAYPYQTPLFAAGLLLPIEPLAIITSHQNFNVLYNGTTQVDGHTVHEVRIHLGPAGPPSIGPTRDIFIDTTTFQVVMVRDSLPQGVLQEVHYSGYRSVDGVLVPFSIAESIDGQSIWSIQLKQIIFNNGLQASAFVIQ